MLGEEAQKQLKIKAHVAAPWIFNLARNPKILDAVESLLGPNILLFGASVRRIPLSQMGIIQYLAPTLQFLLGVLVYDEAFGRSQLVGYGLVWVALLIFAIEGMYAYRAAARPVAGG